MYKLCQHLIQQKNRKDISIILPGFLYHNMFCFNTIAAACHPLDKEASRMLSIDNIVSLILLGLHVQLHTLEVGNLLL